MKSSSDWVSLSTVQPSSIEFLWKPYIPLGAITVLEGDPGTGKSSLIVDIAARVTTGGAMPNSIQSTLPPSSVLLISPEMSQATLANSFRQTGANLERVYLQGSSSAFSLADGMDEIRRMVAKTEAKLLIVDPITPVLGVNINNDQLLRKAIAPLGELADQMKLSVVLIRHLSKTARRSVCAGAGSIGLTGLARSVLLAAKNPSEMSTNVLAISKSNVSAHQAIGYRIACDQNKPSVGTAVVRTEWLESIDLSADTLLQTSNTDGISQLQEAEDVLFSLLQDGPLPAKEVIALASAAGVAQGTLRRAKKRLGIKSRKHGFGTDQFFIWSLPRNDSRTKAVYSRSIDSLCDDLFYDTPGDASFNEYNEPAQGAGQDVSPLDNRNPLDDDIGGDIPDDNGDDNGDTSSGAIQ